MWAKTKTRQTTVSSVKQHSGFTIVELLIVIVVIGILATITVVAYNGVKNRAWASSLNSTLTQASKKIQLWHADNGSTYPATIAEAGLTEPSNISFQYTNDNSGSPADYCLTATREGMSYYVGDGGVIQEGICPGHNLLVWEKTKPGAPTPIPNAILDTSVFRVSTASMRLNPGNVAPLLRGNPYTGEEGQTYTVSLWILSDSNWNGLGGNSKIRFGRNPDGAWMQSCSYNGVKLTWTQVSCSFTLTSTVTGVIISVGNDGTVGNIWLDDISVSRSE
ncbi:hypothetical protein B7Z28_01180 [Candidatus Saccharibacteria bacterium 32-45-3]|nr:MAG: hypothetical protein B7Z28_01180 [Candidatus Saccharibacteria bacterium 32-45-3]